MQKLMRSLLLSAGLAVMIVACKSGAANMDPKAVLTEFMAKLAKKDIDGAAKLATKDSKAALDMMKKGLDMAEKMKGELPKDEDPTEEFKNVEIGEAKIDGETATVAFTSKKNGKTVDFPLKKEDGAWKVDFSMATLMKMGMDAKDDEANEMPGGTDTMSTEDMQKSLQAADSLIKSIDPKKLEEIKKAAESLKGN